MEKQEMSLQGKKVLVVGMALSGVASAKLLCSLGADVTVNDNKLLEELPEAKKQLADFPVHWKMGQAAIECIDGMELVVLSPVISKDVRFAQQARENGAEVIGEIELGYRYMQGTLVGITGTNGKTTTTALAGQMYLDAGRNTHVLGNIGLPISEKALETQPNDVVVAEVAGFQLESTVYFHPHICAFLNITPDHLDRFGTMENYIASKLHIFKNQSSSDIAILNMDDGIVGDLSAETKAKVWGFSLYKELEQGAFIQDDHLVVCLDGKLQDIIALDDIFLPGLHNVQNAMAATLCALAGGVPAQSIAQTLRTFKGVEHRIEMVSTIDGVTFYNDSKGTNPDSTIKAIEAMILPTVLIAGGFDKHADFGPMFDVFGNIIKAMVVIGETRQQLLDTAKQKGFAAISAAGTLEEATQMALALAEAGENVLLSPACASYDMFQDFEERGRAFKQIVRDLEER